MTSIWLFINAISGFKTEIVILALILFLKLRQRKQPISAKMRDGAIIIAAYLLFRLMGELVKSWAGVPRPCWSPLAPSLIPCPNSFSFPSGHALGAGLVAALSGSILRGKRVWVIGFVLALLVAAARVMVGVHTPLDVIAGLVLGYTFGILAAKGFWHG